MNHLVRFRKFVKHVSLTATLSILAAAPAFASTGASGLPWEKPLQTIQGSLTGPVALAISVVALFAAGAGLVFGEEMSNFVKRVLIGVMSLALLVAGSTFISNVFPSFNGFTI
jgi:type IV secretory pathway VirB2 component (pilin)